MSDWIDLHALWQVVLVGLIFGRACRPCSPSACAR